MKKVMAVAAGFLVALAPAGTAFAGEPGGNAWGNCKNSASGEKTVLQPYQLKNESGLGGWSKIRDCKAVEESAPVVVVVKPVAPEEPVDSETWN